MPIETSVTKPKRAGRPVFYDAMKVPQTRETNNPDRPATVLVAIRGGAETHIPCSLELYQRVFGRQRAKGAHTGYDNLRDYGFVIWHAENGSAIDVDRVNMRLQEYPEKTYAESDEAHATMDIEFTKAGTIHVTRSVVGVSKADLFQLVKDFNAQEHLEVDQKIGAKFEVSEVSATKARLNFIKK